MTHEEQKKMIEALKRHIYKMDAKERSDFEMMVQRDKDDEDFDEFTRHALEALYSKYLPKRSKEELERAWKKFLKGQQ